MHRENEERADRIVVKEEELNYLEDENRRLLEKRDDLLASLDNKKMTLSELYENLEELRLENARLLARNEKQRLRKNQIEEKIRAYQDQIMALKEGNRVSEEEKRKRIAALKQQIRNYLEIIKKL